MYNMPWDTMLALLEAKFPTRIFRYTLLNWQKIQYQFCAKRSQERFLTVFVKLAENPISILCKKITREISDCFEYVSVD